MNNYTLNLSPSLLLLTFYIDYKTIFWFKYRYRRRIFFKFIKRKNGLKFIELVFFLFYFNNKKETYLINCLK